MPEQQNHNTQIRYAYRRLRPWAGSWTLASLLLGSGIIPAPLHEFSTIREANVVFAGDVESKPADKYDRTVTSYGKIKLNYYSASWARVFQDLTDTFEMEFVGDQTPSGRFSRNDMAEHTRKDAIRIINHEIEPQGFRLIEKGRYLILLETNLRRPQAPTPTQPQPRKPAPRVDDEAQNVVQPANHEVAEKPRTPPAESGALRARQLLESDDPAPAKSRAIQLVAHQETDETPSAQPLKTIVDRIENWKEAEAPQVHLITFKNVDCQAAAELLSSIFGTMTDSSRSAVRLRTTGITMTEIIKSNSLLLLASESDLEAIVDVASKIDTPIEPQTEFQVFGWRASHAMDVEMVIEDLAQRKKSLAARALIIPSPRSNSIIVRAKPQDLDEIEAWLNKKSAQLSR